jgi:hypothetical protein
MIFRFTAIKMLSQTVFSCFLLGALAFVCQSCGSQGIGLDENADSVVVQTKYIDTLRLIPGRIPEDWKKISLLNGFYVGFPEKPSKQEQFGHFVKYQLRQKEYALFFSYRDLEKDTSFAPNREEKAAYYRAVVNDLADDLELDDVKSKIVSQNPFMALEIYEGLEATIVATDGVHIFMRTVMVGSTLYTGSCIAWVNPSKETLQLKDLFLYSFGKDLMIQ